MTIYTPSPRRLVPVGKLTVRARGAAWALLLATAAACTTPEKAAQPSEASSPASSSAQSASPTQQASDVTPPELDEGLGETRAGSRTATRGNATLEYSSGAKGKALIVAVSCKGGGTIKVKVPVVGMSFPLQCSAGEPDVTYNQIVARASRKAGTVSVTAPSSVTWSVTVGRADPAQEETP